LARIEREIEELRMEKDDLEKMKLDSSKKHEGQLKALNQNLANLRVELKQQNEKLMQAEITINEIRGSNLEMEARLSNCMDERNELIERCISAEKFSEQMKTQNIELKRKLEDAQSALHELGSEHQALQVFLYFFK
jgi:chromosome segregation ATPase